MWKIKYFKYKVPFTLIAGPCQLESEKHALDDSSELKKITEKLGYWFNL